MAKILRKQDFIDYLEENFPEVHEDVFNTCRFQAGQGDSGLGMSDTFNSLKLSTLKSWYPDEYKSWLESM